ncbi:uncharacterized protein LOC120216531 [Hibiscus syriacus]|uniref:uncharacterized protein LOC120216531 n=1 Tax=Hibiscus syriacus TaxID=106335 RepID=UPI0019217494|nr:uncharacterized protein LOC120216531 [Hibiscus syriacus]
MIASFWNIRGFNNPLKQNKVLLRAFQNKVDVLCLLETRVKRDKSEVILNSKLYNYNVCTNYNHAINRRIWILWRKGIDLSIIQVSGQSITAKGTAFGGDFNIFLHSHESSDHELLGPYSSPDMSDFQEFTHELNLLDHPYLGPKYTWSNKHHNLFLARKLDRILINPSWDSFFHHSFVEFLAPGVSDYSIAIIWLSKESPTTRPKPFKFFNFWASHPHFLNVVRNSWSQYAHGNPMMILFSKFRRHKDCLKKFNKDNFSNLSDRVKLKRIELENIQLLTLKAEDSIVNELQIQDQLKTLEEVESLFLKQKAKVQWIKE